MEELDRREFLRTGVAATFGLRSIIGSPVPVASAESLMPPVGGSVQSNNLLANGDFSKGDIGSIPVGWSLTAMNPALAPSFKLVADSDGKRVLMAEGNGRQECFGYLWHPVRLAEGKTYRLRVRFRYSGFDDVNRHLVHSLFGDTFNTGVFRYKQHGNFVVGEGHISGPPSPANEARVLALADTPSWAPLDSPRPSPDAQVRLCFRYSARGKVWWDEVLVEECEPIPARPVKVAVSWGERSMSDWEHWLDAAGARKADIALLPEMFDGNAEPMKAQPEDGPARRLMAAKARQWKMYVSGSTYVRRGDLVFNSAPLFDREGKLVGVYDKNMLYDMEVEQGATPGQGFPVFQTEFGKVGIIICYDSWFPETTQMLALKGAKLILLPNAGYYMQLMHARSADNGVFIAVSSLDCPAGLWDSGGNQAGEERKDPTRFAPSAILDYHNDEANHLLMATVDLSEKPSPHYWGGPMRSAPGGHRCRKTWLVPCEAEIAQLANRWYDAPTD